MKFKYFMLITFITVFGLQYFRVKELHTHFTLKQERDFIVSEGKKGDLKIENPQKHLVLYSEDGVGTREILYNLNKVFEFTKTKYDSEKINEYKGEINDYSSVIIVAEDFTGMRKEVFLGIKNFIEDGGSLIVLERSFRSPFNFMGGILDIDGFTETSGIKFYTSFFPGMETTKPSGEFISGSSLKLNLSPDAEIIAASENDIPLIWETPYGNGRIIYSNTSMFEGNTTRGLLTQLIAYGNDYFIMPVFNSKIAHIDDFPAPIPSGDNKKIHEEYNMNNINFFKKVWWPDMESIAQRQKLRYTAFIIGDYTDATDKRKIVDFTEKLKETTGYFGREVFQDGGELGFHGYNHFSLALEEGMNFEDYGYTPWAGIEDMVFSLEKLKDLTKDLYGEDVKIFSYVPPSNIITKEGKKALTLALPKLKSISGIYMGDYEPGLLLQEVGRDPDYPKLYSLPRFSAGFHHSEDLMWSIYNAIGAYGCVSHFIHPDDITDQERGDGKSWEELKKEYEKIFSQINIHFPLLDSDVQSDATLKYMQMENLAIDHEKIKNTIKVNFDNYKGPVNTFVRIRGDRIKDVENGEFHLIEKTAKDNLYLVRFDSEKSHIILGGEGL
ncbi:DUF2194 domain-containing protein [uncultured Ilyobacter sp.]|uniref:DUF2194 domain-containing protein n=1 Tax=uncultured Ilyobacter sp. TaxID=544433 RepID=UPI0029C03BAB|nr:DUF2194 domain-containing protein [uncultured Ilyobacter sp.]